MNNLSEDSAQDPRSTDEIVRLLLTTEDEDLRWEYIYTLQARGGETELAAAAKLCQSERASDRIVGINILGQSGMPERSFPQTCGEILLALLASESDSTVLASVGIAIGHLQEPRAVAPLAKWKDHPNPGVRMGVVLGLTCQTDELAIATLIELAEDEDADIRNWATFALSTQIDTDTPAIRDALFARAILELGDDDPYPEIRGEALVGLAIRQDRRVIPALVEELSSECVTRLAVEAAAIAASPRLYPVLVGLQDWWDLDPELLAVAITSCESGHTQAS